MLYDLHNFIGWYLAPWRKMKRGQFTLVVSLAFLPVFLLQFFLLKESVGQTFAPLKPFLAFFGQGHLVPETQDPSFWVQYDVLFWLNTLIFIGLMPAVWMRLRDHGMKKETSLYVFTACFYASPLCDVLAKVNITLPLEFAFLLKFTHMCLLLWLCVTRSERYVHQNEVYVREKEVLK